MKILVKSQSVKGKCIVSEKVVKKSNAKWGVNAACNEAQQSTLAVNTALLCS